jgi:hypothetical protein
MIGDMAKANQHIVPNFYLKKFRDASLREYRVWQYEKGQVPRAIPTVRTAAIDHCYTLFFGKGRFAWDEAEKRLSRRESEAAQLFDKIESRVFRSSEKKAFAEWMDVQMTRVPCYRDCMVDAIRRQFLVDVTPSYALAYITDKPSNFLAELPWGFLAASGSSRFVTSDNPVHFFPSGVVYPLNPNLALVASESLEKEGLTEVGPDIVEMVNLSIISGAKRFVFASERCPNLDVTVQQNLGRDNLRLLRAVFESTTNCS